MPFAPYCLITVMFIFVFIYHDLHVCIHILIFIRPISLCLEMFILNWRDVRAHVYHDALLLIPISVLLFSCCSVTGIKYSHCSLNFSVASIQSLSLSLVSAWKTFFMQYKRLLSEGKASRSLNHTHTHTVTQSRTSHLLCKEGSHCSTQTHTMRKGLWIETAFCREREREWKASAAYV